MKIAKILGLVFVLMLFTMPMVAAEEKDWEEDPEQACENIKSTIQTVINLLTIIAAGIAVVMAIVVGIMFMQASDPADKDRLGSRLKQLIIGIIIVVIAGPLVSILMGSIINCASVAAP